MRVHSLSGGAPFSRGRDLLPYHRLFTVLPPVLWQCRSLDVYIIMYVNSITKFA